jgi:hypothetical protein
MVSVLAASAGSGPKFELFDRDLSYRSESVIVVYLQVSNLSVISWRSIKMNERRLVGSE